MLPSSLLHLVCSEQPWFFRKPGLTPGFAPLAALQLRGQKSGTLRRSLRTLAVSDMLKVLTRPVLSQACRQRSNGARTISSQSSAFFSDESSAASTECTQKLRVDLSVPSSRNQFLGPSRPLLASASAERGFVALDLTSCVAGTAGAGSGCTAFSSPGIEGPRLQLGVTPVASGKQTKRSFKHLRRLCNNCGTGKPRLAAPRDRVLAYHVIHKEKQFTYGYHVARSWYPVGDATPRAGQLSAPTGDCWSAQSRPRTFFSLDGGSWQVDRKYSCFPADCRRCCSAPF